MKADVVWDAGVHWRTLGILAAVYVAWFALVLFSADIPWPLLLLLGGFFVCLHGSLQHETIHGNLTPWQPLNTFLVYLPLGLWMPYHVYRFDHLRHHLTSSLTDPYTDPESFFIESNQWSKMSRWVQMLLRFNNALAGRLLVGPWIAMYLNLLYIRKRLLHSDWVWRINLLTHLLLVGAVLYVVSSLGGLSVLEYILMFAWPGTSLILLRSYLEHQPAEETAHRTVIVEGGILTRLLFLNNNYHAIHHDRPGLPWYRISSMFEHQRQETLSANGGYYYRSYWEISKRYLLKVKHSPEYPLAVADTSRP